MWTKGIREPIVASWSPAGVPLHVPLLGGGRWKHLPQNSLLLISPWGTVTKKAKKGEKGDFS
jgi:hypothetical protein